MAICLFGGFVPSAFAIVQHRSPWQNGYAERHIGSIRRECLDHVVVFGERHLRHMCCPTWITTTLFERTLSLAKILQLGAPSTQSDASKPAAWIIIMSGFDIW